jgi:hypothetical protein
MPGASKRARLHIIQTAGISEDNADNVAQTGNFQLDTCPVPMREGMSIRIAENAHLVNVPQINFSNPMTE